MIEYTRVITDQEEKCLLNDLVDIKDWIDKAIEGKINNCLQRAARQYGELAKEEKLSTMPVTDEAKATALFAHASYEDRTARDAKENI